MNKHLEPIFKIVIFKIEESGISYWVYGGVAIAGIKGYFYRDNQDVDIFVLDKDYEKAIEIIQAISDIYSWTLKTANLVRNIRPKNELFIGGQERLSIIPVYERDDEAEFIFPYGSKKFPREMINPISCKVGILKYLIPSEHVLRFLLEFYIEMLVKSGKLIRRKDLWNKYKQDTKELLGDEGVKKFFCTYR